MVDYICDGSKVYSKAAYEWGSRDTTNQCMARQRNAAAAGWQGIWRVALAVLTTAAFKHKRHHGLRGQLTSPTENRDLASPGV